MRHIIDVRDTSDIGRVIGIGMLIIASPPVFCFPIELIVVLRQQQLQ